MSFYFNLVFNVDYDWNTWFIKYVYFYKSYRRSTRRWTIRRLGWIFRAISFMFLFSISILSPRIFRWLKSPGWLKRRIASFLRRFVSFWYLILRVKLSRSMRRVAPPRSLFRWCVSSSWRFTFSRSSFGRWTSLLPLFRRWTSWLPLFRRWTSLLPLFRRWMSLLSLFRRWTSWLPLFRRWTSWLPSFRRWMSLLPSFRRWTSWLPLFRRWMSLLPLFRRWTSSWVFLMGFIIMGLVLNPMPFCTRRFIPLFIALCIIGWMRLFPRLGVLVSMRYIPRICALSFTYIRLFFQFL